MCVHIHIYIYIYRYIDTNNSIIISIINIIIIVIIVQDDALPPAALARLAELWRGLPTVCIYYIILVLCRFLFLFV